ncbi:hypothetical protein FocTR4_00012231 [Fusarium oxysporum f. sp. cubense]|uniref:Uncharacterized protein n=1 Tax=Fusarium oxysporum f. sp. cubense TaxID=61366 RepID=A0A5C6SD54_FUSOC|nr:hypothetical protein FocTR4_00012231 [Fusarium oxysporum f. sp. cubense]
MTANTWAYAREPLNSEPSRCGCKNEKIYYYMHCDAFAKAGEVHAAKQLAKREETLRYAINHRAALEALI